MNALEQRELSFFMEGERLRVDGSNFADWYSRLRTSLKRANILFTIEMHVEEHPDNDVGDQEILDHYVRRQKCSVVRNVMIFSMSEDLSIQFQDTDSYDMMDTLKTMFVREFRVARFELESKFLSTKMEERTSLGDHLDRMHEMYLTLVEDYEYWTMNESTTEEFAINTLLHSLPPSYGDYVHSYVGSGANMSLQNFMTDLLAADIAPIEDAEVVDGEGIYLIYFINVCSLIQHLQ
jgi:gag-polypeptide of LTR copia-type